MENREVQIKEFQNQKMELETSLYQQSISLKTHFDALIEEERHQNSKELDDLKFAMELERSQINNEYTEHVALLKQQLDDLRLKVASFGGIQRGSN